jgi:hypothetical protein
VAALDDDAVPFCNSAATPRPVNFADLLSNFAIWAFSESHKHVWLHVYTYIHVRFILPPVAASRRSGMAGFPGMENQPTKL